MRFALIVSFIRNGKKVGNNTGSLRFSANLRQYSKEITAWDFNSSIILHGPVKGYCWRYAGSTG